MNWKNAIYKWVGGKIIQEAAGRVSVLFPSHVYYAWLKLLASHISHSEMEQEYPQERKDPCDKLKYGVS